jgi:hypothetical protein
LCIDDIVKYLFGKCNLNVMNTLEVPERIRCESTGDFLKSSTFFSVYVNLKKKRDHSLINLIHSSFSENMIKCCMFSMKRIRGITEIKIVIKPLIIL